MQSKISGMFARCKGERAIDPHDYSLNRFRDKEPDAASRNLLVSLDLALAKCESGAAAERMTTDFGLRDCSDFYFLARSKLI
jgi:hypothetical protein